MRIRDIDLAVRETGHGPRLVWGHGLLGSMAQEDDGALLDASLLEGAVRLVRYDARGHGRSEATLSSDDYRWPALARDMLGVLDACGDGPASRAALGGISMGCATALHAAVRAPERVRALVLVAPPTAWKTRPRQSLGYRLLAVAVDRLGLGPFLWLAALPRPRPGSPARAALERSVTRHLRRADARAVACALRGAAASDLPAPSRLARLAPPALILAWRGDASHPVSSAERLAELLPSAELHVADSEEEIRGFTRQIVGFLAEKAP